MIMLVILDTNILIDLDKRSEATIRAIRELLDSQEHAEPAITWVTFSEFYYGSLSDSTQSKKALDFLKNFTFLPMDEPASALFAQLRKDKVQVSDFDLLIASVVLTNDAVFITRDQDFKRVPGLNVVVIT